MSSHSLLLCITLILLPYVYSHTYLLNPKPRTNYTGSPVPFTQVTKYPYEADGTFSSFNKIGWCGSVAPAPGSIPAQSLLTNIPTGLRPGYPNIYNLNMYTPGSAITVYWAHALVHPDPNVGSASYPIFKYGIRVAINYSSTDMVVLNEPLGPTKSTNGIDQGHIEQAYAYDPQSIDGLPWIPNATFVLPVGKTCDKCVLQFWLDAASDGGGYVDCADISITSGTTTTKPATTAPTTAATTKPTTATTNTPTTATTTKPTTATTTAPTTATTTKPTTATTTAPTTATTTTKPTTIGTTTTQPTTGAGTTKPVTSSTGVSTSSTGIKSGSSSYSNSSYSSSSINRAPSNSSTGSSSSSSVPATPADPTMPSSTMAPTSPAIPVATQAPMTTDAPIDTIPTTPAPIPTTTNAPIITRSTGTNIGIQNGSTSNMVTSMMMIITWCGAAITTSYMM